MVLWSSIVNCRETSVTQESFPISKLPIYCFGAPNHLLRKLPGLSKAVSPLRSATAVQIRTPFEVFELRERPCQSLIIQVEAHAKSFAPGRRSPHQSPVLPRLLVLALAASLLTQCAGPQPPACTPYTCSVQGRERLYWVHDGSAGLHSPTAKPSAHQPKSVPVVFVFHGGDDSAAGVAELTHFTPLADQQRFIVVYPEAYQHQWNDGRDAFLIPSERKGVDDVAFTSTMLKQLQNQYAIDPRRIYATGFSNGAIFCHLLGARMPETFAAVAPVSGAMAEPVARQFHLTHPLSILAIHGTADPSVPYQGGNVDLWAHGRTLSVDQTMELWRKEDHCLSATQANADAHAQSSCPKTEHCAITTSHWVGDRRPRATVELTTVHGGGHAWPGGPQYLPAFLIGPVCPNLDATAKIWEFFLKHPKVEVSQHGKP